MPRTIIAKTPADLLGLIPQMLGFAPTESLVMLNPGSFTARLDLPRGDFEREEANASLIVPALRHQVQRTVLIAYTADHQDGIDALLSMSLAAQTAGLQVLATLLVDGITFATVASDGTLGEFQLIDPDHGEKFAPVRESREALAAATFDYTGDAEAFHGAGVLLHTIVATHDDTLLALSVETARDDLETYSRLVRTMPEDHPLRGEVAAFVGVCAWLAGNGALCWEAIDRCNGTGLHPILTHLMENAISPATWDEFKSSLKS